jgi:pyruvate,orthophosphate dikinase
VREMILSDDAEERKRPLAKIMPMQKGDFKEIFREMKDLPVTIRLLDPPLHEFLPHEEDQQRSVAEEMGKTFEEVHAKVRALAELNPMLGHRGCRLGVTFPEIYDMQVQAIFEAACELAKEGMKVVPEVMIPLVGTVKELSILKTNAIRVAEEVMQRYGVRLEYSIGTMIEVPRAALVADGIAKEAAFFSFGTNDLTQMTFGYSRDDAGKFLPIYIDQGILEKDPFQSIDQEGVGQLVKMAVEKGRTTNPKLKCGVCGEHGGDPASIFFFHKVGLDYVSCSPYRVPVALMATAHAELKARKA